MAHFNRYPARAHQLEQNETSFQAGLVQEARMAGWLTYHTHDSRKSEYGFPDLVLVKPPLVLFAELKTARGQPTPEQCQWLEAIQHCTRVEGRLWRPTDALEIDVLLGLGGSMHH